MKHQNSSKKDRFLLTDKTQPTKIIPFHTQGATTSHARIKMHFMYPSNTLLPPQPTGYIRVKKHDHF